MKQNTICSYEEAFYLNHHVNIRNKHFCAKKDFNVFMEKSYKLSKHKYLANDWLRPCLWNSYYTETINSDYYFKNIKTI